MLPHAPMSRATSHKVNVRGNSARLMITVLVKSFLYGATLGVLGLYLVATARAQVSPTLTTISPSGRTDLTTASVSVTLTGTGFTNNMVLVFDPAGVIDPNVAKATLVVIGSVKATATFTLIDPLTPVSTVNVWVKTGDLPSAQLPFNTGVASDVCLEALQTGGCALLWEVDTTSATGSSGQSNNSTAPNIIVKLDYEWHPPKNSAQRTLFASVTNGAQPKDSFVGDHLDVHVAVKTGYTQIVSATKVQPTTPSSTSCPGSASASTTACTIAVPQSAFVADGAARLGWATGVDGGGVFSEFGLGVHGSFQYLIPSDKIVTSAGLTYIDLSSANPQNAVGFYEATGHFRLSQLGHDKTLVNGNTQNVTNLVTVEGGYQNNRGLQQLMTSSPQTNTRNRYVARFYVNPEISSTNHTQLTMGIEYSGGIAGGPHVVQLFFGANLNPSKLFSGIR